MINPRFITSAYLGAAFIAALRFAAACGAAAGRALLAAMHESRAREAARHLARHRHLSEEAEMFYQREYRVSPRRSAEEVLAFGQTIPLEAHTGRRELARQRMRGEKLHSLL